MLARASNALSELLNQQKRDFLLYLQELSNFRLIKRAALFKAMLGKNQCLEDPKNLQGEKSRLREAQQAVQSSNIE